MNIKRSIDKNFEEKNTKNKYRFYSCYKIYEYKFKKMVCSTYIPIQRTLGTTVCCHGLLTRVCWGIRGVEDGSLATATSIVTKIDWAGLGNLSLCLHQGPDAVFGKKPCHLGN